MRHAELVKGPPVLSVPRLFRLCSWSGKALQFCSRCRGRFRLRCWVTRVRDWNPADLLCRRDPRPPRPTGAHKVHGSNWTGAGSWRSTILIRKSPGENPSWPLKSYCDSPAFATFCFNSCQPDRYAALQKGHAALQLETK